VDMREADRRALRLMFGPLPEEPQVLESSQQGFKCTVAFIRTLTLQVEYEASSLDEIEAWAEEQMHTLMSANYSDAAVRYRLLPGDEAARVMLERREKEVAAAYTTTVNLDDSEDEIPFAGLEELLAILDKEQRVRRKNGGEPLEIVQVTIWKEDEAKLMWSERPVRFVSYEVYGSDLGGIFNKSEDCEDIDDILATLGLPA
jgi:hypothetical protein